MQLSKNFSLRELTRSQVAARRGIDNTPPQAVVERLRALAENVLQPVRDHFGAPVVVTSGYRSPELNDAIGSSDRSQHPKGEAADFEVVGRSNLEVAEWIRDNLTFDQLILEFYTPGDPRSGWVHCSYVPPPRNQVLTARRGGGYVEGLDP